MTDASIGPAGHDKPRPDSIRFHETPCLLATHEGMKLKP